MSIVRTLIGNIKGPAGATGATGATGAAGANGADGAAATVNVGTVSTTAYGNPAQVINSGTESAAVLDFVIPQGQPGEEVTDMAGLTLGTMTTQTSQFPTPQIGDNGATLFGKIVKYFSDLRTLIGTKLNTSNVVNNFTTTESGYALDARAGKTLNDSLNAIGSWQSSTLKTTSVPNGGGISTVVDSITVDGGVYLIIALAKFDTNANGLRMVSIAQDSTALDILWFISGSAAPTGSTSMQMTRLVNTTAGTHTLNLVARHTGGSDLNVTTRMFAVCLRNTP